MGTASTRTGRGSRFRSPAGGSVPARHHVPALAHRQVARRLPLRPAGRNATGVAGGSVRDLIGSPRGSGATLSASHAPAWLDRTSGGPQLTVTDTNALVDEIANRFWEKILELDPVQATILGDDRFDDRLPDLSPEGRAKEAALSREVLAEAETIGRDELETEGVITRDMLMLIARNALEAQERKLYQLAVDHIWGVQTMPVLIAQYQKADSTEGLEKLLKRYAAYPTLIDQQIETLREGIRPGVRRRRP
ncbi:MAG: DUF885 domain-containing protein [Chloroflexi bacterium]|nr:MAG: DUF885 domain-containing protein [Chloroflexota bacterium]